MRSSLKHLLFLLTVVFFSADLAFGQYILSPESEITFVAKHLGVFNVNGKFTEFSGKMNLENDSFSGEGTIIAASIQTGNKSRDKDLVSDNFLDVDNFPHITFVTQKITQGKPSTITGLLTIKEKSRTIDFPYELTKTGQGILIEFDQIIDRTEFDLYFQSMNGLVGDEIEIRGYLLFNPN